MRFKYHPRQMYLFHLAVRNCVVRFKPGDITALKPARVDLLALTGFNYKTDNSFTLLDSILLLIGF